MSNPLRDIGIFKMGVLGAAIMACTAVSMQGHAQEQQIRGLEEIVVTAQRRAQSMQDVPVAVTALTEEALQVNRVTDVTDLSGLAPNLTARPSAGGANTPSFSMRGVTSYGVVPGSDKQISIYLDGVYIGSTRASMFALPDIAQLEILRGPQGTLFGRNATAGAINITTRDPSGEFRFVQEVGFGNRNHQRFRSSIDLPEWNGFSASASYVVEKRDGDIRNLGAGTTWDRTAIGKGIATSPKRMNDTDDEIIFVGLRYEPNDVFSATYKFDYSRDKGTPEATVAVANNPAGLVDPGTIAMFQGLLATNPHIPLAPDARRPSAVNNDWATPLDQEVMGHNLTLTWDVNDQLTLKSINSYREIESFVSSDISGLGGIRLVGPMAQAFGVPDGTPMCIICIQPETKSEQWSTEIQANYTSDFVTLTGGALYYRQEDNQGSPGATVNNRSFTRNTFSFGAFPGFVIPTGTGSASLFEEAFSHNKAKSQAIFAQAEFHVAPQVDLVAGWRLTRDEKWGFFRGGTADNMVFAPFSYAETRPSYMGGVNWRPADDLMLYAKYSEAFVSGGSVGGVAFEPEIATSVEVGMKADFLDNRLRTNLALFDVTYENLQTSQSGRNVGRPDLSTAIIDLGGDTDARGLEFEATALLDHGFTLNGSLGYTDVSYSNVRQVLIDSVGGNMYPNSQYLPSLVPRWTGSLSGQYESAPIFGEAYVSLNLSGTWRSEMRINANPAMGEAVPQFRPSMASPSSWVVNARAALRNIDLGPAVAEIALWGRNLTDNDYPNYALTTAFNSNVNFMEARTYGIDFRVEF